MKFLKVAVMAMSLAGLTSCAHYGKKQCAKDKKACKKESCCKKKETAKKKSCCSKKQDQKA